MVIPRRAVAVILILVLALPLSGCWNRRELNTLGIIGLVGVDAGDNGIKATFEIIKPEKADKSGGEKAGAPVMYVQSNGRTIIEALRYAPLRFDRKLFVSHTKGFLFSEEIARNGLAEHLDVIMRDHEMRISMHLVIVKGSSAADVMGIASGINTIPVNYIEDLLKQYKVHSASVDSKVVDFLKAYTDKGINPVVTVLTKVKKPKITGQKDEYELSAEGAAVFLKDRLVGFLDAEETRGYNWVIGKVVSGVVTFPIPDSSGTASVEILQAESKKTVEITDNNVRITVKISMAGMIDEQTTGGEQTDRQAVIKMLEQATSRVIEREVERTLTKVQKEYKSDIFGFGQLVHRKYPKEWRNMQDNWDELFSQATVKVEAQAKIMKTGKSSSPVKEK